MVQKPSLVSSFAEALGNFIEVWGFVMLMVHGFIQVSGVKVDMEGVLWLMWVGQG